MTKNSFLAEVTFKEHPTLKLVRDITDCFAKQKYCSYFGKRLSAC